MNVIVQRLGKSSRVALVAHYLALSVEDRRLRFGAQPSHENIRAYIDKIDFDRDAMFAVHDEGLVLVGAAHLAFGDELAELGLSVLPAHRRYGIGSALFERAATHARNRFASRLFMHCLTENAPIMRMARRFGMGIVTSIGEADALLELPPASPASIGGEFVTEGFALYDYALKAQVAAWKRIMPSCLTQTRAHGAGNTVWHGGPAMPPLHD
jgi:GNAT superfamily N-acetyltransferase